MCWRSWLSFPQLLRSWFMLFVRRITFIYMKKAEKIHLHKPNPWPFSVLNCLDKVYYRSCTSSTPSRGKHHFRLLHFQILELIFSHIFFSHNAELNIKKMQMTSSTTPAYFDGGRASTSKRNVGSDGINSDDCPAPNILWLVI
jgi:hypothetical protein